MTEISGSAAERLAALMDRIPDSSHVTVAKDDLRAVLAQREDLRGRLLMIQSIANALDSHMPNAAYLPMYLRQIHEQADVRRVVLVPTSTDSESTS